MQVGTCFGVRGADLKTQIRPVTQTCDSSLMPSYNLDLKPLGPYKNEPLLKIFTIHRKIPLSRSLFNKVAGLKVFKFF